GSSIDTARSRTAMKRPAMNQLVSRLLGVLLAGVLLCSPVAAAHHHHGGNADDHACALCNASHAPAVVSGTAAASPAPALLARRVHAPAYESAAAALVLALPSRAPPLT